MKAQAESTQTLVLGVYAREFPGGLLKLDPALRMPSLLPHDLCHGRSSSLDPSSDRIPVELFQHHLSGSGIAQLDFYHCWEPVRNSAHDKGHEEGGSVYAKADRASGVPLESLEHLPPKPESVYFLLCAPTYTSDFMGGCPPLPLSEKRVSLQFQLIIPGCDSV